MLLTGIAGEGNNSIYIHIIIPDYIPIIYICGKYMKEKDKKER